MDRTKEQVRLEAALSGDKAAQDWMASRLQPVLQKTAAGLLWSIRGAMKGRATRQDLHDLANDGWDVLLDRDGRALRRWDPETGPLDPYVAKVVKNRLVSKLRTLKHNPFTEDPTQADVLERIIGLGERLSSRVEDADLATKVLLRVWARLTPLGREVLQVFLMDGASVEDVMAETGLSKESVRSWRKRIRNIAREELVGLQSSEEPS